jgi:hypothetical protein
LIADWRLAIAKCRWEGSQTKAHVIQELVADQNQVIGNRRLKIGNFF